MSLQRLLSEELWVFILFAIILALAFPVEASALSPYAIYFLLVVMFFTSLRIDIKGLEVAVREKGVIISALASVFIISPGIAFLLSGLLNDPEISLGLVLYAALPTAMANAFYMGKLGKDAAQTLLITAITTLCAPLLTPIVVRLVTGTFIEINTIGLFLSLIKLIILPFIFAEGIRRLRPSVVPKLLERSGAVTTVCIFFVVLGVIASEAGRLFALGGLALTTVVLLLFSFAFSYIISPKKRFELAYSNAFRNGTLGMVVALDVFGAKAALPSVMVTLIHNLALVFLMFWAKERD